MVILFCLMKINDPVKLIAVYKIGMLKNRQNQSLSSFLRWLFLADFNFP
jgi:hypothetical protein